ncbi:MAG: hypothetical protein IKZ11_01155, partial [Alistipes sp.]|nr:hypothetical protein [Alistipes sp.]
RWWDSAAVITRGPLLYALKMEEKWEKHICEGDDIQKLGKYYYEVTSPTQWNVAVKSTDIAENAIEKCFTVEKLNTTGSTTPWSLEGAPLQIKAKGLKLPTWGMNYNSAADFTFRNQQPAKGEVGEEVEITLIPFGCTTLRITEFPVR